MVSALLGTSPVLEVLVPILPWPRGGWVAQLVSVKSCRSREVREKAEVLISAGRKGAGIRIRPGAKFMIFKTTKNQTPPMLQLPETPSLLQQRVRVFKVAVHLV